MICACQGCDKRHVGCHAGCAEYAEFKRQIAKGKRRDRSDKDAWALICAGYVKRARNVRKKQKKAMGRYRGT